MQLSTFFTMENTLQYFTNIHRMASLEKVRWENGLAFFGPKFQKPYRKFMYQKHSSTFAQLFSMMNFLPLLLTML